MGIKRLPEPGAGHGEIPLASVSSHLVFQCRIAHWSPGVFPVGKRVSDPEGKEASPQLLDINRTSQMQGSVSSQLIFCCGCLAHLALVELLFHYRCLLLLGWGLENAGCRLLSLAELGKGYKMSSFCVASPVLVSLPIQLSFSTLQSSLVVSCIVSRVKELYFAGRSWERQV